MPTWRFDRRRRFLVLREAEAREVAARKEAADNVAFLAPAPPSYGRRFGG